MSTRSVLRATLYWHIRKGRRLFQLFASWLTAPLTTSTRSGVRWG
jgi:hypothetical protein